MSELRPAFLCAVARCVSRRLPKLHTYYLMRCKAIAINDTNLPTREFGPQTRCAHCCMEWIKGNYDTKILPLKNIKSLRKRLRRAKTKGNMDNEKKIKDKMHSNSLERLCHFCKKTTVISCLKPNITKKQSTPTSRRIAEPVSIKKSNSIKQEQLVIQKKRKSVQIQGTNVYCNSKSAFTMDFVKTKVDEKKQKKTGRKNKDKFAGLCREAVLASAKHKNKETNNSKLNLFLRPSL